MIVPYMPFMYHSYNNQIKTHSKRFDFSTVEPKMTDCDIPSIIEKYLPILTMLNLNKEDLTTFTNAFGKALINCYNDGVKNGENYVYESL